MSNHQIAKAIISLWEQVVFHWDDGDVCFVLNNITCDSIVLTSLCLEVWAVLPLTVGIKLSENSQINTLYIGCFIRIWKSNRLMPEWTLPHGKQQQQQKWTYHMVNKNNKQQQKWMLPHGKQQQQQQQQILYYSQTHYCVQEVNSNKPAHVVTCINKIARSVYKLLSLVPMTEME